MPPQDEGLIARAAAMLDSLRGYVEEPEEVSA